MNKEYVKQIVALKMSNKSKQAKVLSASSNLTFVEENTDSDKNTPLQIVSGYSRIVLNLLDQSQGNNFNVTCNITTNDVKYAYAKTRDAMIANLNSKETNRPKKTSPAYTVKITMGKAKGKTPVEAIAAGFDLNWNLENLDLNHPQYGEANKRQAAAIKEAMSLPKEELHESNPNTSINAIILHKDNLTQNSKTDDNGNVLTCDIQISCDYSRNYPFQLTIHNGYCPLKKDESGRQNTERKSEIGKMDATYNMTEQDWFTFISECYDVCALFKSVNAQQAFDLANKYAWKPNPNVKELLFVTKSNVSYKGSSAYVSIQLDNGTETTLWFSEPGKLVWFNSFKDACAEREVKMKIKGKINTNSICYMDVAK